MRVAVIGARGTIGSAVVEALEGEHHIFRASRNGPIFVDLTSLESIQGLFTEMPELDAIICCAASGVLAPLPIATDEQIAASIDRKMLGQVRLAVVARRHLPQDGVIVLTGGNFDEGAPGSAIGLLVNGGLDAFARAANQEDPAAARIVVVHPGWVSETLQQLGMDPGLGTPASKVAQAYQQALLKR